MGQIHRSAVIDPDARVEGSCFIGAGVKIRQFASVTGKTVLGRGTSVSPFAMLHGPDIGPECVISGGVMMGPGFKLGRGVFVGPNAVLCNDAWPRAHKDGYRADLLAAGHYCVIVEDGASIGASAVVLPGVRIGAGAMIAAGETVTGDVPPGHLYRGGVSRKFHREAERMRWAV